MIINRNQDNKLHFIPTMDYYAAIIKNKRGSMKDMFMY